MIFHIIISIETHKVFVNEENSSGNDWGQGDKRNVSSFFGRLALLEGRALPALRSSSGVEGARTTERGPSQLNSALPIKK